MINNRNNLSHLQTISNLGKWQALPCAQAFFKSIVFAFIDESGFGSRGTWEAGWGKQTHRVSESGKSCLARENQVGEPNETATCFQELKKQKHRVIKWRVRDDQTSPATPLHRATPCRAASTQENTLRLVFPPTETTFGPCETWPGEPSRPHYTTVRISIYN